MEVQEQVRSVVEPLLTARGIELFDVELVGTGNARVLRLSVDRASPAAGAVDLDTIAEVSQIVSPAIDAEFEASPALNGRYTLEVSSPGLERPLRLPTHFRRVIGETVSAKTHREVHGARRHQGVLVSVDDDGFILEVDGEPRAFRYDEIATARTVFEWGPAPKPGAGANKRQKASAAKRQKNQSKTRV